MKSKNLVTASTEVQGSPNEPRSSWYLPSWSGVFHVSPLPRWYRPAPTRRFLFGRPVLADITSPARVSAFEVRQETDSAGARDGRPRHPRGAPPRPAARARAEAVSVSIVCSGLIKNGRSLAGSRLREGVAAGRQRDGVWSGPLRWVRGHRRGSLPITCPEGATPSRRRQG